uniref:B9 domain-containing protein 2 n=1 Tax=Anopheles quadriannulatus TaxID=34691 RepID=A0A182XCT8_ANOQN
MGPWRRTPTSRSGGGSAACTGSSSSSHQQQQQQHQPPSNRLSAPVGGAAVTGNSPSSYLILKALNKALSSETGCQGGSMESIYQHGYRQCTTTPPPLPPRKSSPGILAASAASDHRQQKLAGCSSGSNRVSGAPPSSGLQHLQPSAPRTPGQINGASSMGNLANHTAGALHLSRSSDNLPSLAASPHPPAPPPVPKHQNIAVTAQEHHTATCPCSSSQQQQQHQHQLQPSSASGDPFAAGDTATDKVIVGPAETIVGIIDTRPPEARHPIILKVDEKADQSLILTAALTPNNVYQFKPTSASVSTTSLNGFVTVQTTISGEQTTGGSLESATASATTPSLQYKPAPAQPQPTPQRQPQPQPRTQFTQPAAAPAAPGSSSAAAASNNHQRHQSLPANSAAVGAKILPHPPSKSITSSQLAASAAGGGGRSGTASAGHPLLYENVNLASSGPVKDCPSQRHAGGAGGGPPSLSSALNNNNNPNVPYENINLEYIARLMQEGYSKENVITALGISRNNIEMACDILHEFMAELHIIGELQTALDFEEPNLFCRWSIQYGSHWKAVEGHTEGQSCCSTARIEQRSEFGTPIDLHLVTRGLQGWPRLHVEVYAVNALQQYWPVGYGFAFVPASPGQHRVRIATWKVSSARVADTVREKFHTGGFSLAKSDIAFSGIERYKLLTRTAGTVELELMLIFKNFAEYGINVCDINCCCDIDCSAAILRTFDCDQELLHTDEYHHGEGLQSCRVQGGLFCLVEPVYEEGDESVGLYAQLLNGVYPELYPTKGEGYDKLNLYLSKYGNPRNRSTDWVRVRSTNVVADAEPGSEQASAGSSTDNTTDSYFTCTNMLISVNYRFYYARTLVRDVRHQAVVHDAEIVFGPRVNLRFRLEEEIRVPIFLQVQFFDLTSSSSSASFGVVGFGKGLLVFGVVFTFFLLRKC